MLDEKLDKRADVQVATVPVAMKPYQHSIDGLNRQPIAFPRIINPHQTIKRLFGEKHWAATWIKQLCESDVHFLPHLIEQEPTYIDFLCLFRLAFLKQDNRSESIAEQAKWIRMHSKKEILQELYPDCANRILKMLPKLKHIDEDILNDVVECLEEYGYLSAVKYFESKFPWAGFVEFPDGYHQLLDWLADDKMYKCLSQKDSVHGEYAWLFKMLKEGPEEFRTERILNLIESKDDYEDILVISALLNNFGISMSQKEINNAAKAITSIDDLPKCIKSKFKSIEFPSPHWEGNERIRPVRSRKELKIVAKEFKNCLNNYADDVVLGDKYFYVCESPPAVIGVEHNKFVGWCVGKIRGVSNTAIHPVKKQKIIKDFCDSGFLPVRPDRYATKILREIFD